MASSSQLAVNQARSFKKSWPFRAHSLLAQGYTNHANSCYRNATLQCLLHLVEFCHYLARNHRSCDLPVEFCVSCALRRLCSVNWPGFLLSTSATPKPPINDPVTVVGVQMKDLQMALLSTVPRSSPLYEELQNDAQSDAYDLLGYLLEELEKTEVSDDRLKLSNLFAINHEVEWQCEDCAKTSLVVESSSQAGTGAGLCVNILQPKRNCDLMTYLRNNVYREEVDISCDSYQCTARFGAGRRITRERRRYITQAPEILVLRLNRFTLDEVTYRPMKLRDAVTFDEVINLGEFTRSGEPLLYKLQGVVAHSGSQVDSGHFIAAVRRLDGKNFYTLNDDQEIHQEWPGEANVRELQFPRSRGVDFDPYLLFYSRVRR